MPSTDVTALKAHTYSYDLCSPITPIVLIGSKTANAKATRYYARTKDGPKHTANVILPTFLSDV